jgi:hypothetical protein
MSVRYNRAVHNLPVVVQRIVGHAAQPQVRGTSIIQQPASQLKHRTVHNLPVVVQSVVGHAEQLISLPQAVPGAVVARVERNSRAVRICRQLACSKGGSSNKDWQEGKFVAFGRLDSAQEGHWMQG